jgi:hypothetical protein
VRWAEPLHPELNPSHNCAVVELLRSCLRSRTGLTATKTRLESVSHGTRNRIVTSILGRCQEVAELANDRVLSRAAYTIRCLVSSMMCLVTSRTLWASFQHHDFLRIQGRAISLLCDKAQESRRDHGDSWEAISGSIFTLVASTTPSEKKRPPYVLYNRT